MHRDVEISCNTLHIENTKNLHKPSMIRSKNVEIIAKNQ